MPYRNWADTDTLNAADLNAMTADPDSLDVATAETTASSSYGDLTTVGPTRTVQVVAGQTVLVVVSAQISSDTSGEEGFMTYAASGAATVAAADSNAANVRSASGNAWATSTRVSFVTATSAGTLTIASKYKRSAAGTARFANRRLLVKKF